MYALLCKRGGYSPLINRTCSSLLLHSATVIPPFSPDSSSVSLSDNLYNSRRGGQILSIPQLVNANIPDTLTLKKKLEAQGLPSKQAEGITSAISECFQETEKLREGIGEICNELQLENITLRGYIDRMRLEFKHEVDKATVAQRLELNLESGQIRDELFKQISKTSELNIKFAKETHVLRAQLESAKLSPIKYGIGAISLSGMVLGILSLFSQTHK